nr:hypothetical protein [Anaerolineae bacterium]
AYTFLFAYINTAAQEIGMERAIELDTRMCETMGAAQGMALKEQAGMEELGLEAVTALTERFLEDGLGITSKLLEEDANRRLFAVGRCPVYEAAAELGMDHATIEALCRSGAIRFMDTMVKQMNPALSYQLQEFRSSAEGSCKEAMYLS